MDFLRKKLSNFPAPDCQVTSSSKVTGIMSSRRCHTCRFLCLSFTIQNGDLTNRNGGSKPSKHQKWGVDKEKYGDLKFKNGESTKTKSGCNCKQNQATKISILTVFSHVGRHPEETSLAGFPGFKSTGDLISVELSVPKVAILYLWWIGASLSAAAGPNLVQHAKVQHFEGASRLA